MREETSDDQQLTYTKVDDVKAYDFNCEEYSFQNFDQEYESEDDKECDLPSEAGKFYTR